MNTNTLGLILMHIVTLAIWQKVRHHKFEGLDGKFKERSGSQCYMLGIQIPPLFKALVLPTFTYGTKVWGDNLKNSH